MLKGHVLIIAIGAHPPRRFGRKAEKRLDRPRGPVTGPKLEHLPQQNQDCDDRRRFEINRNRAIHLVEGGGEYLREESGDNAVAPGNAGAERDKREHVEIAREQRPPSAHEKRPPRPKDNGSCEQELQPVGKLLPQLHGKARQMPAHFQNDNRNGQHKPNPKAPCHIRKFVIGGALGGDHQGLKRHAADRAGSGALLADFRMHRAGVDGPGNGGFRNLVQIFFRRGYKFCLAARRAEIIAVALVRGLVFSGRGINRHAADRINGAMSVMFHVHLFPIVLNPEGVYIRLTDIPL